jgi:hypothetical protein
LAANNKSRHLISIYPYFHTYRLFAKHIWDQGVGLVWVLGPFAQCQNIQAHRVTACQGATVLKKGGELNADWCESLRG